MMFSGRKGSNALNFFGQNSRGKSSLTVGLLNDLPPEIELSDYHRVPSPGSESPSGLLDGEQLGVKPIADLDLFFERLYNYYCEKGLWCIIVKWIFELFSLAFTICFSGFFLLYVDWNGLRNAKCGMDAVESGVKPCDLVKEALNQHPLTPFTISKAIIVGYLGIFTVYWIFCFLRFFIQLKETLKVREFYHSSLQITDNEIQTMQWALVLQKVVHLQSSQQICVVKDLSIHDIVMRLMRKENYLIGMINKGLLAFPISNWVPGAGPTVKFGPNGVRHCLILTKTLEWSLNWCILQSMFDRNFCIRRDFINDPEALKKRLRIVGMLNVLLSPFLVIFMLVYLFLRHAEQFYHHPSTASSRRWSNLSKWIFREFNEVDHFFKHRISSSIGHASNYLKQFPTPIITLVAKFISFVSGGFAAVLIIIAIMEASLLEGHVYGHNLLWYTAIFGTVTAISRAAVSDELPVPDPQGAMSLLVQQTHYMPKRWRGKENTEAVKMEFETLFQYTGMMLLEEMASIFLTPYLLLFVVPERVNDILQFIADFTVDVEGVGHVCSFSVFDFQKHGNKRYGSPFNASRFDRSSQGKMEKSFLGWVLLATYFYFRHTPDTLEITPGTTSITSVSMTLVLVFSTSYPAWEPNNPGKRFLSSLKKFKQQKLQVLGFRPPNFRVLSDRNSCFSRGSPLDNRVVGTTGYQSDLMVITNGEQQNHPYILDWYYTSYEADEDVGSRSLHDSVTEQSNEALYKREDSWGDMVNDRARTHLEASTSTPLLRELVVQNHDMNSASALASAHPTNSHWWARNRSSGYTDPETSFLEPPNFDSEKDQFNDDKYGDNNSSIEEGGGGGGGGEGDWLLNTNSRLSRTFLMDDLTSGGGFSLPFDDIYGRSRSRSRSHSPLESDPTDMV